MLAMDLADLGCIVDLYCWKIKSTKWLKLKLSHEMRLIVWINRRQIWGYFSFGICQDGWNFSCGSLGRIPWSSLAWIQLFRIVQRALMLLNLYGHEDVRHKLNDRQKSIFCVFKPFLSLCQTHSRPYRLSNMNALCINQFY